MPALEVAVKKFAKEVISETELIVPLTVIGTCMPAREVWRDARSVVAAEIVRPELKLSVIKF